MRLSIAIRNDEVKISHYCSKQNPCHNNFHLVKRQKNIAKKIKPYHPFLKTCGLHSKVSQSPARIYLLLWWLCEGHSYCITQPILYYYQILKSDDPCFSYCSILQKEKNTHQQLQTIDFQDAILFGT